MKKEEILICENHQYYQTPLVSTMAFTGAELWCPYCGEKLGMFDGGKDIEWTQELQDRKDRYRKKYLDYLHANAVTYASGTEWQGKTIYPRDLPKEEQDRLKLIRENDWKECIRIEELLVS